MGSMMCALCGPCFTCPRCYATGVVAHASTLVLNPHPHRCIMHNAGEERALAAGLVKSLLGLGAAVFSQV